jgi:hypothetical protein
MVPTGNVILGFDYASMTRFLNEAYSYESLVKDLTKGDSDLLLFNNEANPNFISFEHSLAVDGEPGFKITFIDPNQEFENRFIQGGMFNRIAGSVYNKDVKSITDTYGKKRSKEVSQTLSKFDRSFYSELATKLEQNNTLKEIYVIYGTGNNLKLWSGPHKTYFTNVDISPVGAGARKITLSLQAVQTPLFDRQGAFNEKVDLNLAGLSIRCNGASQPIVIKNFPNSVYDTSLNFKKAQKIIDQVESYKTEEEQILSESGFETLVNTIKSVDIHSIVVDAIRNYIQSATRNKNVIVLIPNINTGCREFLLYLATTFRHQSNSEVAANKAKGTLTGSCQASMNNSIYDKEFETLGNLEGFIRSCLLELGIELDCINKETTSISNVVTIPHGQYGVHKLYSEYPNSYQRFKNYYNRQFTAILSEVSNEGLPDHYGKIKKVFDLIQEASKGNYSLELEIINETQLQVLDFWSKGNGKINPSDYPTFGGYDKFNEKTEAIIVGDKGLIAEYLYGNVNFDQKQESIDSLMLESVLTELKADDLLQGNKFQNTISRSPFQSNVTLQDLEDASQLDKESRSLKASTLDVVPLHPLDKIILLDKRYQGGIKNVLYIPITGTGSFGDISFIPDEFAYSDANFSEKQKNEIRQSGIPVFRYNLENPNVLDLNIKISDSYTSMLKLGYSKVIARKASATIEGLLPEGIGSFPIQTKEEAILFLRKKQFSTSMGNEERNKVVQDLIKKFDPDFVKTFSNNDPNKAAQVIVALLDVLEKVDYKQFIEIGQQEPSNPVSVLSELFFDLYQKCTDVTIKTLPTFHISRTSDIVSTHCLLLAQDVPILTTNKPERSPLNTFMTGQYKIVGFRHIIDSTQGLYSEFNLVKPVAGLGVV